MAEVEPEWKKDFEDFIGQGVARKEFLDHVDICTNCQKAIEEAYEESVKGLEQIAKMIQEERAEAKRKREEKLAKLGPLKRCWHRLLYFTGLKND